MMAIRPNGRHSAAGIVILLLAMASWTCVLGAYELDMVFQTKCIFEEVEEEGMEVTGNYQAFLKTDRSSSVAVNIKVEDPDGKVVFDRSSASDGAFRFAKAREGEYKICFSTKDYQSAQHARLRVEWKTGAEAHDWESVAKKDNLNSIQTEMKKLTLTVHDIHLELQQIRRKEEQMRDINESINARVAWFSIIALLTCLALAGWQLWYLRKFFIRKKVL